MRDYAVLRNDLALDLKTEDVMLTSDMTLPTARALWMSKSFWKKFQDEIGPDADRACLALFDKSNAECATFVLRPESSFDEMLIGEVKASLDNVFHRGPELAFGFSEIFAATDIGPGASIDVASYNFYTKLFDSTLSCTNDLLYQLYRSAILKFPEWTSADDARRLTHGNRIVEGNRLSFVPKTSAISRSICVEPVLNMFFQKGLGSVLQNLLKKRFKIDLSRQPELNRRMARIGSLDGSFCTIDLSSASDSISLLLLKKILPSYVFRWLDLIRSPYTTFPDGRKVKLAMVSTMGNAFTFPLMTLLFSTLVTSCYRVLGISPKYTLDGPENFAVFGDDIIVRKDAYAYVVHCLELFGFTVNVDKSFSSGDFRESCGGDYWRGHDIRGVYISSLKTRADIYSAINRIVRWSAKTGILLPNVVKRLAGLVSFLPIPYHAGDAEGIKLPFPPAILKRDPKTGGVKYNALSKETTSLKVPETAAEPFVYCKHGGVGKPAHYNASGILEALTGGYIRNGRILLRDEREVFKVRRRVTSKWRSTANSFFITRVEA